MKPRSIPIILTLVLCLQGCKTVGKLSSSELNPYRGAVKDILPQSAGDYSLVHTSSLQEIEHDLVNPTDGVGAIYNSSNNHTVQHLLANFRSAAEANRELDAALKRYQDSHVNVRVEDVKDSIGQTVGKKLTVNDGKTEALNWTNGSLYCTAVSYTGYSTEFAKNLPY